MSFQKPKNSQFETTNVEPSVYRCVEDVWISIFRIIIEQEVTTVDLADQDENYNRIYHARTRLLLVCKQWKEIVYRTPTLWRLIQMSPFAFLTEKDVSLLPPISLLHLRLTKSVSVDLSLPRFPGLFDNRQQIDALLNLFSSVRSLHIDFVGYSPPFVPPFLVGAWPQLKDVEKVSYTTTYYTLQSIDLSAHLAAMRHLTSLELCGPTMVLPRRTDQPLLPVLRILKIIGGCLFSQRFHDAVPSTLSHCPALEELEIEHNQPSSRLFLDPTPGTLIMPRLKKIKAAGLAPLTHFLLAFIKTPALSAFNFRDSDWRLQAKAELIRFFDTNPTITTVQLSLRIYTPYHAALITLVNLQCLTIASQIASGAWVLLCTLPQNTSSSPVPFPNLRRMNIKFYSEYLKRSLEPLAVSRCIPILQNGRTALNFVALERLRIFDVPDDVQRLSLDQFFGRVQINRRHVQRERDWLEVWWTAPK